MPQRALLFLSLLLVGCISGDLIPEPPGGSVPVSPETSLNFYAHVDHFYQALAQRRFNTLETFNDPALREQFRTERRFFDYYADLAQSFFYANFERSRPESVEVQAYVFENPNLVRVQVRFVGDDDRPLRPNKTALIRLDRWQRFDGRWWMTPDKL
jgi:hypothetical protein